MTKSDKAPFRLRKAGAKKTPADRPAAKKAPHAKEQ